MSNPFNLGDAVIRDEAHVRVIRRAPKDGRPCEYMKMFKSNGLRDADYWTRREYDFLLYFSLHKLKHVVEFSLIAQDGDGRHTPIVESITTRDAGITIADWLGMRPIYTGGETLRHPFRHAGMFLELLRACLVALREIHERGVVHCDIKEDNICLPYTPYSLLTGQTVRMDFSRLRLIDFAFSIMADRPLICPLPIKVLNGEETYQSEQLKLALTNDGTQPQAQNLQAQQLDYRSDLYSLGFMAGNIAKSGLLQPLGKHGHAAVEGAIRLVDSLKSFNKHLKPAEYHPLPHNGLIAEIDGLLAPLEDLEAYRQFRTENQSKEPPYDFDVTQIATNTDGSSTSDEQLHNGQGGGAGGSGGNSSRNLPHNDDRKYLRRLVLVLEILGGLGGLLIACNVAMRYGFLDWTGICQLIGNDQQIRECRLPFFDKPIIRVPVPSPFRSISLPTLPGENVSISSDGLLTMGLSSKQYKKEDAMQIQLAVAIPFYVRVFSIDEAKKINPFFLGIPANQPVQPGSIGKYPPSKALFGNLIDTDGMIELVAIASETPFPKGIELLDNKGRLTKQAEDLSPTVVRLGYEIK